MYIRYTNMQRYASRTAATLLHVHVHKIYKHVTHHRGKVLGYREGDDHPHICTYPHAHTHQHTRTHHSQASGDCVDEDERTHRYAYAHMYTYINISHNSENSADTVDEDEEETDIGMYTHTYIHTYLTHHREKSGETVDEDEEETDRSTVLHERRYPAQRGAAVDSESENDVIYTDVDAYDGSANVPKKQRHSFQVETRQEALGGGPASVVNTPNTSMPMAGPSVDEAYMVCMISAASMVGICPVAMR
jgi:hypothetical protein